MSITAISIAWAFLQIAILCSMALSVAWSLRGRRPQLVTAMLAGTCIASLLLAMISVVPKFQWTLAIDEVSQTMVGPATPLNIQPDNPHSEILADSEERRRHFDVAQFESHETIATNRSYALETIRTFISQALQRVDREVRDAEVWQRPVAKARNLSLILIVLIGLSAMSLLWCSSWLYMRRVLRCSQAVDDSIVIGFVATQARGFGLRRTPSVRESTLVPIGATVGWRRVTVLLHTDWREWTAEERTAVIAHELAHAARHDFAWVLISSWIRILLFFHPMVHVLIHRLRMEQELAADQLAAGKVGNARAYGRALASLALRSQPSLGTSNLKLGSILSAGQICVTRRVKMLRQGSLKPIQSRSRWSIWAVVAIACSAIPLAGLRGTTQEPVSDNKTISESPKKSDSSEERDAAEQVKPKPLSKEFLAAYPPVEIKGVVVYRPGRFRSGEFGPEAAWFQEWFAISMFGKPMSDRAVVHGQCNDFLRWTDEERKHGINGLETSIREGESTIPGQLTRFADPTGWQGQQMRTVSTQQIEGRTIAGVTISDTALEPEKWLIDDEQGYLLGSQDQAMQFARGQKFALDSIPQVFREDYQNAAFGIVYDHCDQWANKLDAFYKGSPREQDFQILGLQPTAILKDLKQLGVFADGCKTPACSIRAVMQDDRAAKRLATQMTTLVELGKVAVASMPSGQDETGKQASSSILETMTITATGSEVHFQFDIFVPSLAEGQNSGIHGLADWINFNSEAKCETIGSALVRPTMSFSTPSLVGQTIDAMDYRGKTVLLELDMQCNEDAASETGAYVWASRHEPLMKGVFTDRLPLQSGSPYVGHRVLVAKSTAADGVSAWADSMKSERRMDRIDLLPEAPSRTLTVPLNVPSDADHLSFGFYFKSSEIRVRNVKFQVSDANQTASASVMDATEDVPYNAMVVPGYKIRKSPTKRNFEPASEASVEFAARPSNAESR